MSRKKRLLLPGYLASMKDEDGKKRYLDKLHIIGGLDPYETERNEWQDDVDLWPSVTYVHLGMYLLVTPSPYSGDDLMNYKSLDCYNNFLSGWVREVLVRSVTDDQGMEKRVVTANVNHSQRLSEKPLTPWIIAEPSGKILCAHCNCMAGLGESCSHVASLLWAIEAGVRVRDSMTVTQKKAYWVIPSAVKDVPYAPVKSIDFIGKKRSLAAVDTGTGNTPSPSPSSTSRSPTPAFDDATNEEAKAFFASLSTISTKPAILSLVEPYASKYIPKSLDENLPLCLSELYKPEYLCMNYGDLLKVSEACEVSVSEEQAKVVESKTRVQSKSPLWFRMRTGRITASYFKSVSHTSPASPSISLIMSICHPEISRFQTAATHWGCEHEKIARDSYATVSSLNHENFRVDECGLFISTEHPFAGATPDGLVACGCCGDGICEIKCPYCHKENDMEKAVKDTNFCLVENDGKLALRHDHSYYYQVQCQLFCAKRSYCDFIVWTQKEIHIERIYPDERFWLKNVSKVKHFFTASILPQLIGKFYSRTAESVIPQTQPPSRPSSSTDDNSAKTYCYCHGPEYGDMVGCDNPSCLYEWFHLSCLKLVSQPKSKFWYCPDCRKLPEFKIKRSKKFN